MLHGRDGLVHWQHCRRYCRLSSAPLAIFAYDTYDMMRTRIAHTYTSHSMMLCGTCPPPSARVPTFGLSCMHG